MNLFRNGQCRRKAPVERQRMTTLRILAEGLAEYGEALMRRIPWWMVLRGRVDARIQAEIPAHLHRYVDWKEAATLVPRQAFDGSWEFFSETTWVGALVAGATWQAVLHRCRKTGEHPPSVLAVGLDAPVAASVKLRAMEQVWMVKAYPDAVVDRESIKGVWNPFRAYAAIQTLRTLVGPHGDLWLEVLEDILEEILKLPKSLRWRWTYQKGIHYGDILNEYVRSLSSTSPGVRISRSWKRWTHAHFKAWVFTMNNQLGMPSMRQLSKVPAKYFWRTISDRRNWVTSVVRYDDHHLNHPVEVEVKAFRLVVMPKTWREYQPMEEAARAWKWANRWETKFGHTPKAKTLRVLKVSDFEAMPVENFKWFSRLLKLGGVDLASAAPHTVLAAWRLAALLGQKCLQIWPTEWTATVDVQEYPPYPRPSLTATINRLYSPPTKADREHFPTAKWSSRVLCTDQLIHDAGIALPVEVAKSKDLCNFLARHLEPTVNQRGTAVEWPRLRDAIRVAQNWELLSAEGANLSMPFKQLAIMASMLRFKGVISRDFAAVAAECGVTQHKFEKWQDKWLATTKNAESIPSCGVLENEGYIMYRLGADDPRGVFLGHYTDCCQHPGGAGSSCAWHGHQSPDGAFFVVEKNGKIVTQSWAWRHKDGVCFDNVEALSGHHGNVKIKELYERYAAKLLGKMGISAVTVGLGFNDLVFDRSKEVGKALKPPEGIYTDAARQVVLAATPEWHARLSAKRAKEIQDYTNGEFVLDGGNLALGI